MDMILLNRQFLALGQEVIFIGRRGDGDVLGGCNGDIALGIDLGRDGVDLATRSLAEALLNQILD